MNVQGLCREAEALSATFLPEFHHDFTKCAAKIKKGADFIGTQCTEVEMKIEIKGNTETSLL